MPVESAMETRIAGRFFLRFGAQFLGRGIGRRLAARHRGALALLPLLRFGRRPLLRLKVISAPTGGLGAVKKSGAQVAARELAGMYDSAVRTGKSALSFCIISGVAMRSGL